MMIACLIFQSGELLSFKLEYYSQSVRSNKVGDSWKKKSKMLYYIQTMGSAAILFIAQAATMGVVITHAKDRWDVCLRVGRVEPCDADVMQLAEKIGRDHTGSAGAPLVKLFSGVHLSWHQESTANAHVDIT